MVLHKSTVEQTKMQTFHQTLKRILFHILTNCNKWILIWTNCLKSSQLRKFEHWIIDIKNNDKGIMIILF